MSAVTHIRPRVVFDTEVYVNYFCVCFKNIADGRSKVFEMYDGHPLDRSGIVQILRKNTVVGFNSINFDMPIIRLALRQATTTKMLKTLCDQIIKGGLKPWHAEKQYDLPPLPFVDHIDLIEPAPSVQVGLKLYAGRLHSKRLQDLPIDPSAIITPSQRLELVDYCLNGDCDATIDLYRHIEPQLNLRATMSAQYGVELRSKSDAQIAETVIRHEIERMTGERPYRPELSPNYSFKYLPPDFLSFRTKQMQDVFEVVKNVTFRLRKTEVKADDDDDSAVTVGGVRVKISGIQMPVEIVGAKAVRNPKTKMIIVPKKSPLMINIGSSTYKMGIGGLHSTESKVNYSTDSEYLLRDADVGAFYPQLILVCGLYPEHLGPEFLEIYRSIRDRRMDAKSRIKALKGFLEKGRAAHEEAQLRGDLAASQVIDMTLKIVLNGSFGKLGSKWSFLYSPNLMIQVTITGQLVLLMLIERLELAGISVVSANTDGIVSKIPRHLEATYHEIVKQWEVETGFEMEFADYAALYSRDVNNYLAVKPDGSVKQKGAFAFTGSKGSPAEKNPTSYVCIDAVIAYLVKGTPIMDTLEWCADIRRFLTVRRVTGGATYAGEYLGKTVRWFYAKGSDECISSAKNGNKVAKSDGCRPMMNLTSGLPADLDYDYYYNESLSMLGEIGVL